MKRFWAILFLLVPIFGVATFVVAPYYNHWFPQDISEHGRVIDQLFMFILWLTGIVFVATEGALFWFVWKYDGRSNPRAGEVYARQPHAGSRVDDLPAVTLLFIAIYQMNAWADAKMRKPDIPVTAEITGRQFDWDVRYPGQRRQPAHAGRHHSRRCDMHLPVNEEILLIIKSQGRAAQLLPAQHADEARRGAGHGPVHVVQVHASRAVVDIVCAELCGWGHYKMKGRVTVESREDFDEWLEQKYAEQETRRVVQAPSK